MFSKEKTKKLLDSISKKLFKIRSKKHSIHKTTNPCKKAQPKHSLSFYLSDQCSSSLNAFTNLPMFPKSLQRNFQDLSQIHLAFNNFKGQDAISEPFEHKIDQMRFLTNSQEGLIERFLQDKYSFSKSSGNLQEIYCYSAAKNLLQTQFQEFFLKRNEFLRRVSGDSHENMEGDAANKAEIKEKTIEGFNENSFSTTHVGSPSINGSYGTGFSNNLYNYHENLYNMNAKLCNEMMLNMQNENENLYKIEYL